MEKERVKKPREIGKIHGGLTHEIENRLLYAMVPTVAKFVKADVLSMFALAGTAVMCVGILAAGEDISSLLWVILGMVMHWFGDGLDGKVARARGEDRPRYGYYIDRIFDNISLALILVSMHLSGLSVTEWWLYVLVLTLMLGSHLFLKASVTGMFEMQIGKFGGLELKGLGLGLILTMVVTGNPIFIVYGTRYTLIDLGGLMIAAIMSLTFVYQVTTSLIGKRKIED